MNYIILYILYIWALQILIFQYRLKVRNILATITNSDPRVLEIIFPSVNVCIILTTVRDVSHVLFLSVKNC